MENETSDPNIHPNIRANKIREQLKKYYKYQTNDVKVLERAEARDDLNHFVVKSRGVTYHYFSDELNEDSFIWDDDFEEPNQLISEGDTDSIELPRSGDPIISTTPEGESEIVSKLSFDRLRRDITKPELFDGKLIGAGNEGKVYLYKIGGQDYVVKIYDEEIQHMVNSNASYFHTIRHPEPVFFERLTFSETVAGGLSQIPTKSIAFEGLKDYVAGFNFHIMALGPKFNLTQIKDAVDNPEDRENQDIGDFIKSNNITQQTLTEAEEEIDKIKDIVFVLQWNQIPPFYSKLEIDLENVNLLVKGVDLDSGKLALVLIDQGQKPPMMDSHAWDTKEWKETARYKKVYRDLMNNPQYSSFLIGKKLKRPR